MEVNMTKFEKIEQENVALRECINSVLITLADYDGYRSADGLMKLIDEVVETLKSGYPSGVVDYYNREVCPLCFQVKSAKEK